jgi:predicted CoA-binding protein
LDREVTHDAGAEPSSLRVLLVDWPHHRVPGALLEAGFRVFGLSPRSGVFGVFIPGVPGEGGHFFFKKLHEPLTEIDIVAVHGPVEHLMLLVTTVVLPLRARAVWVERAVNDGEVLSLAASAGVTCIEGGELINVMKHLSGSR